MSIDYRGAKGSNTGDDFHEWWALRHAISLLDSNSDLCELTVEGVRREDQTSTSLDTWDGVDCALYFGDQPGNVSKIIIEQLKYSPSRPDTKWTIVGLTKSDAKTKNNSIIRELADAFIAIRKKYPDLANNNQISIRLVSNQPIYEQVDKDLKNKKSDGYKSLKKASGIRKVADFSVFANSLDFSFCGTSSRFHQEEQAILEIARLTEDSALSSAIELKDKVHRLMLPESKEKITRETVLSWFGIFDIAALFPCPSQIKKIPQIIPREISQTVAKKFQDGQQYICLYGEGGCGKTTALHEIQNLLPHGSITIIYDCYSAGRYLDADAYRHRSQEAYLQLANELASRLSSPLLINKNLEKDFPRVFKKRLVNASKIVAAQNRDALLVIAIDAADNSVTSAQQCTPEEYSFIHDFVKIGNLPENVRFLITTRTGRVPELDLPNNFEKIPLSGFTPEETAQFVQNYFPDGSQAWIEDFHHLSNQNPRVQDYAFKYAGAQPEKALDFLRPNGKNLDQIFYDCFREALLRDGDELVFNTLCSGLIALPRPIPISDLAAVTNLTVDRIQDLYVTLPGIVVEKETIGFADEDFEDFVRTKGQDNFAEIQSRIADHFFSRHTYDSYAAMHLVSALFNSGRKTEILELIAHEPEPKAISDVILQRECQRQRLRIAMKVCRTSGDTANALFTLLAGAEALKTDAAVQKILRENPELSVPFASETVSRTILQDQNEIENHGTVLFHLIAEKARRGDRIAARDRVRQLHVWMKLRQEHLEKQENQQIHSWPIHDADIAAEAEAVLRLNGPKAVVNYLWRWRPKGKLFYVAFLLVKKLIVSGDIDLLKKCLDDVIPKPWDMILRIQMALSGKPIDVTILEKELTHRLCLRFIRPDRLYHSIQHEEGNESLFLNAILTGCEIVVAQSDNKANIEPILQLFLNEKWRRRDKLDVFDVVKNDLGLRAFALIERRNGRTATLENYWIDPPNPNENLSEKELQNLKRSDEEKKKELKESIGELLNIYDCRAQILLGEISVNKIEDELKKSISNFRRNNWRITRKHDLQQAISRLAQSITKLNVIPGIDPSVVWRLSQTVFATWPLALYRNQYKVLSLLSSVRSLHEAILEDINQRVVSILEEKAAASDKIDCLLDLSMIVLPFSPDDARAIFKNATDVANEVDMEAMHEIALFSPLSKQAASKLNTETRRKIAHQIASVTTHTSVYLDRYDGFPWERATTAVATLDMAQALAVVGIWEDTGTAYLSQILPAVVLTGLKNKVLTSSQASALLFLVDDVDTTKLLYEIVDNAEEDIKNKLAEILAREELLRFSKAGRKDILEKVQTLVPRGQSYGYWINQLEQSISFHQEIQNHPNTNGKVGRDKIIEIDGGRTVFSFEAIDWSNTSFNISEDILSFLEKIKTQAKADHPYISNSEIVREISNHIGVGDRRKFIEILSSDELRDELDYDWTRTIIHCLKLWKSSPAVQEWRNENLPKLLEKYLPDFCLYLEFGQSELPTLLDSLELQSHEAVELLLAGVETSSEQFDVATLYALIGLISKYTTPQQAANVLERFTGRLINRIPESDQELYPLDNLPSDTTNSLARLLYAFMSDVDVRLRWRAAHAVRCIARLNDTDTLDQLISLYNYQTEPIYRKKEAPFYWIAARLWLLIALDRIADESPSIIEKHIDWMLEIALDEDFPHILVRQFAKNALNKLVSHGLINLNSAQLKLLENINTSSIPRLQSTQRYRGIRETRSQLTKRRFEFDSMDTIPSWYSSAMNIFADVDGETFLDSAEYWIIDKWKIDSSSCNWQAEQRKSKFPEGSYNLWSHRQGSMPTLERFSTHLEWHAMWCAVGELMKQNALVTTDYEEDDYGTFEGWIKRKGLSEPPLWLTDLCGLKPLESRYWIPPNESIDQWIDQIEEKDFLQELGLERTGDYITVNGHHYTQNRDFILSAHISTALVNCKTGIALLCALQTASNSWDYKIPPVGDHLEINQLPYQLLGWLIETEGEVYIDEKDPFRHNVRQIKCRPGPNIIDTLDLLYTFDRHPTWSNNENNLKVFEYQAWGDTPGDEHENRQIYNEEIRSEGYRLKIDGQSLQCYLQKVEFDLIVEVEITRRKNDHEYSRYDEDTKKEARYARILLFKRDGELHAVEGCVGTWLPSSK